MLTKRTNILFENETWERLMLLSKKENRSIGELVRKAVKKTYDKDIKRTSMLEAFNSIIKTRKVVKGKIDYKSLIVEGRKY